MKEHQDDAPRYLGKVRLFLFKAKVSATLCKS